MAVLPYEIGTPLDSRDTLKTRAVRPYAGVLRKLPKEELLFRVQQAVFVWYHRDDRWYRGKVVSGGPRCYQVEFQYTGGVKVRNWYKISRGFIWPDTPVTRSVLNAEGIVLEPQS